MEEQHVMDHVQDDSGAQDDVQTPSNPKIEKIKSKGKRGVIYLSTIPEGKFLLKCHKLGLTIDTCCFV